MPRRLPIQTRDLSDERIRRLEADLYEARRDIVHLAPEEFHSLLTSYYSCSTRAEGYAWKDLVAEQIVDKAIPTSGGLRPDIFGERALCPLCKSGGQSVYEHENGYRIPEGLRRHLVGYGRTRPCPVMKAASDLAWESWNRNFSPREAAQALEDRQALDLRRKTETLYVVGPTSDALLVDEDLFWKGPRPQEGDFSLTWAEQRLFALGFVIDIDGNRRTYTKTVRQAPRELVIYADPRKLGHIHCRIFDGAAKRGKKAGLVLHSFLIRDTWKNNLNAKVAEAIEAASEKK